MGNSIASTSQGDIREVSITDHDQRRGFHTTEMSADTLKPARLLFGPSQDRQPEGYLEAVRGGVTRIVGRASRVAQDSNAPLKSVAALAQGIRQIGSQRVLVGSRQRVVLIEDDTAAAGGAQLAEINMTDVSDLKVRDGERRHANENSCGRAHGRPVPALHHRAVYV